jgi:hypothetical protein
MVQGATRQYQQKVATLCVSNSVFYFISDRLNVSAKLRSGVMRISNAPPASNGTRAVRATGLIRPLSKPAPNLDLVFAYGQITDEI